jgi:hypothetical protein
MTEAEFMQISHRDAAEALHDVEKTAARSAKLRLYERGAPHFILWGILWAAGYGLTYAVPQHAWTVWLVIDAAGLGGSAYLARDRLRLWRVAATAATLFLFFFAAFAMLGPLSGLQIGAFIPLTVACAYILAGLRAGSRFAAAGAVIAAVTLAGFFFLPAHFLLWMAIAGGGAMVSAGLWLRRV